MQLGTGRHHRGLCKRAKLRRTNIMIKGVNVVAMGAALVLAVIRKTRYLLARSSLSSG